MIPDPSAHVRSSYDGAPGHRCCKVHRNGVANRQMFLVLTLSHALALNRSPKPQSPDGGNVSLSSSYVIPGVTASYSCHEKGSFVLGDALRTCSIDTGDFDGRSPSCPQCEVPNCLMCSGAVDRCGRCAWGHGVSVDRRRCEELSQTVILIGKGHWDSSLELLPPNGREYISLRPALPLTAAPKSGAAGLIQGVLYVVTNKGVCYTLKQGGTAWGSCPSLDSVTSVYQPFYATVSGVSAVGDGLYVLWPKGVFVLKPDADSWVELPGMSSFPGGTPKSLRNRGGTAVVGGKIYCVGGVGSGGPKSSAEVTVFDTETRTWALGPPMPTARRLLAVAAYNGVVYAFGGIDVNDVRLDVAEALDIASGTWSSKASMIEPWDSAGTGEMPSFAGGRILIPGANGYGEISGSVEYDVDRDEWKEVAPSPLLRKTSGGMNTIVFGPWVE